MGKLFDGVALTPYYENPAEGLTFDGMVDHAAGTGAEVLSVVVSWAQPDVRATRIAPDPKETQDDRSVRRIIRRARGRGLRVVVFPILWVEDRDVGEWRGTLRPVDEDAWWRSYRAFVLHYAKLAAEERADVFSVGSELASLEDRVDRWRALIADVRAVFPGALMYSANWDHYADVPFWGDLDLVGLTAYHRLTEGLDPTVDELVAAWQPIKARLLRFARRVERPMIFTEVGYPATDGAARSPWDYTGNRPIDFEEQRRCFEAFRRVWVAESALAGVLIWNWWGPGHDDAGWYNPRGKPAEAEVRAWFEARRAGVRARIGPATYR